MKRSTYSRWQCSKCLYAPKFSNYIAFNNHRRICSTFTNLNGSQKQLVAVNDNQNDNFGLYHTGSDGDDELAVQNNSLISSKKKSKLLHGVSSNTKSKSYSDNDVVNKSFSMDEDLNLSNDNFIDNEYISFQQKKFLSLTKCFTHEQQEDRNSFDNHDSVQNVSTNNFSSIGSQNICGISSKLSLEK